MNRIYKYVQKGQGVGIFIIFLIALAIEIISIKYIRGIYDYYQPIIKSSVAQFSQFDVEDGEIVSPLEEYKNYTVPLWRDCQGNIRGISVIFDTRSGSDGLEPERMGIYILKNGLHYVVPGETTFLPWADGVHNADTFGELVDLIARKITKILSWVIITCVFLFLIFKLFIVAIVNKLKIKYSHLEPVGFGVLMRMNSLIMLVVEIVLYKFLWLYSMKLWVIVTLIIELFISFKILVAWDTKK